MFRTFKSPPKLPLSVKCFWRPRPFVAASVAVILLSCHTGIVRFAFPEAVLLRLPQETLAEKTGVSQQRAVFQVFRTVSGKGKRGYSDPYRDCHTTKSYMFQWTFMPPNWKSVRCPSAFNLKLHAGSCLLVLFLLLLVRLVNDYHEVARLN